MNPADLSILVDAAGSHAARLREEGILRPAAHVEADTIDGAILRAAQGNELTRVADWLKDNTIKPTEVGILAGSYVCVHISTNRADKSTHVLGHLALDYFGTGPLALKTKNTNIVIPERNVIFVETVIEDAGHR